MHAVRFEDLQLDASPQNALSVWNLDGHIPTGPVGSVRRTVRRHRTDLSWVPVTLFTLAGTLALCMFAEDLVDRTKTQPRKPIQKTVAPQPKVAVTPAAAAANVPPKNSSKPAADLPAVRLVSLESKAASETEKEDPDAKAWLADALQACRDGRMDDAKAMATQAMHKPHSKSQGQAVWLLVEYLQEYDRLAQQAIGRMNGAVVVDLGQPYGIGAFVEREGDQVLFKCHGKNKKFTVDQLCAREGVEFRITQRFLANGKMPANDLILAAVHIVRKVDDVGNVDSDGDRARDAAHKRLLAASSAVDRDVAVHAGLLLSLIEK